MGSRERGDLRQGKSGEVQVGDGAGRGLIPSTVQSEPVSLARGDLLLVVTAPFRAGDMWREADGRASLAPGKKLFL